MAVDLKKIEDHARSIALRESCLLYDLEVVGAGKNKILRIFIDKEGDESVSIDDCSNVSRALDLLLDVEDLMPGGGYQLEVSSPGLERRLTQAWHFEKAFGEKVDFQLLEPVGEIVQGAEGDKRKKLKGTLGALKDSAVSILVDRKKDREELKIPLEQIKKAKIVYDFSKISGTKKIKN